MAEEGGQHAPLGSQDWDRPGPTQNSERLQEPVD